MKNIHTWKIARFCRSLLLMAVVLAGCVQDPVLWNVKSKEQVIADYVASNKDKYSKFASMLDQTNLNSLLSVRGPFTLFLPTDEAIDKYLADNKLNSIQDIKNLKAFVYNHLITNNVVTGDMMLGALRDTNAIGDFLVTEFQGSDIIVNKQAKIIKRDILCANGYIHVIDKVIDPVTSNIYDKLDDKTFSIFKEGLKRTGLMDTLKVITFPYGKKTARTRFTLLAVADTTFKRNNISTIDDLIAKYTNSPDSIKFLKNGFYRYMEYHVLGGTYYLSDFKTKLYPILSSDNNISVTIDNDYKLNQNLNTKTYTTFYVDQSNVPAKNGAIHMINGLLPVIQPNPVAFTFEVTDYFDMRQGDYFGKYYMKWHDGKNSFAKIKFEGDYLQYYYKNHDTGKLMNWDCLNMNGFWWVEVTTPKIMKGAYRITGNIWSGQMDYEVYVDGVKTATVLRTDAAETTTLAEVVWDTTKEHKVKLVNISWGMLFWDTLIFTPLK